MKKILKSTTKNMFNSLGYDIKLHRVSKTEGHTKPVAFIHVPKSGGISIDLAMREQFAKAGQPRLSREGAIAMSLATFPSTVDNLDSISQFSDHHATQLTGLLAYHLAQNWPYISGHVTTNTQLLDTFSRSTDFVTVLREPVSRFISNYTYNKITNNLPIMAPNNINSDNLIAEVDDILAHRRGWQMANVMSMCITGRFAKDQYDAELIQKEFTHNLNYFKVVGFLNNLDSFAEKIKEHTGKSIKIGSHNTTDSHLDDSKQKIKETLRSYFSEPGVQNRIKHLCRFDTENYLRAQDIYK